jgi:hypothetical protein
MLKKIQKNSAGGFLVLKGFDFNFISIFQNYLIWYIEEFFSNVSCLRQSKCKIIYRTSRAVVNALIFGA